MNLNIINRAFFIAFASYMVLLCGFDLTIDQPIQWGINLIISFLGGLWFGYLRRQKN